MLGAMDLVKFGIIVDVQASRAIRQAEVGAGERCARPVPVRQFIKVCRREILGPIYAAVVATSASRVVGGFSNSPDIASTQRRRASLSEDT
jgi:hypothetical protein